MNIALEPIEIATGPISPEQRLFVGVIVNAVMEAAGSGKGGDRGGKVEHTADTARAWFVNGGEDFHTVCTLAGLEPRGVRDRVLAYLDRVKANPAEVISMRRRTGATARASIPSGVTIGDVAAYAGVSNTTVANVVHDRATVTPETRARVLAAMQSLGYRHPRALEGNDLVN